MGTRSSTPSARRGGREGSDAAPWGRGAALRPGSNLRSHGPPTPSRADQPMTELLRGIRVVDATVEVGELCGRILADLGADVVRLEPPGGSPSRSLPPYAPDGTGLWWMYRNTNKRAPDAVDPAELLRGTDVLLGPWD